VTKTLKKGEEVVLTGFGTFSAKQRAARQGVNPRTGEKIQIPAVTVPKFKAGKALKDALK
ncbi:MAG: DNA-binding protein HU, partial [Chloroflexi bacterium CG_4_10_14_0_8_um_filter_46_9]